MKIIDFDVTAIEYGESFDTVHISILYSMGDSKNIVLTFDKDGNLLAYHKES